MTDKDKPLAPIGKDIQKKMALHLKKLGYLVDCIFYSPTLRTKETAFILAEVFQVPVIEEKLLGMSFDERLLFEKMQNMTNNMAFVGHAPSLFQLARLLIPADGPSFHLERSGTLVIEVDSTPRWEYISPREVIT